ncbi:MAG: GAF domain-containing protein [Anaerolineae bacterium]
MTPKQAQLLEHVEEILSQERTREERLQAVNRLLATNFPTFDWVGFYLVDPNQERQLVLGPYVGEPTEHTHIAFGEGICGQAADVQATFVVDDVREEENYLACSPDVKSEIVVPVFKDGRVVAELDIDSHSLNAFNEEDRAFLERVCERLATLF